MTDTYTPHPGSRLDAIAQASVHESPALPAESTVEEAERFIVNVRSDNPEETIPRTTVLGANNPYLPILARDMARRRAVILAIDNDVVLAETKELAQAVASLVAGGATAASLSIGFYLSKGVVVTIESRDWMFAAATTTATSSRVSVCVERYAIAAP